MIAPTLVAQLAAPYPADVMQMIECQTRDQYLKKSDELQAANREILATYLYWYEGAGKRRLLIPGGPAARAMWSGRTKDERLKISLGIATRQKFPPDIEQLIQK